MAAKAPVEVPGEGRPGVATTTAQAKTTKAPFLCLSSLKLTQFPEGLNALKNLTNLDVSNNGIASIPEKGLPPSLVELTITGCQLTELPSSIGTLPRLKKLFAGANKLQRIEPVFRSQSLQHVGLAYNRVSELPPEAVLAGSPLLSLDLSHNDLEGLASTLGQLALLPSLAALSLGGNPLALLPRYVGEVRGRIKQLLYLDGMRLDLPANSRPGTANSVGPGGGGGSSGRQLHHQHSSTAGLLGAAAASLAPSTSGNNRQLGPAGGRSFGGGTQTVRFEEGGGAGGGGGGDVTAVTLTLRGLRPAEDPFGWLKRRWEEQISVAEELGLTTPPTLECPVPPLQPFIYHLEMTDVEGTPLACVPLRLAPPTPPDVAVMFDPKAKAAAAAAAAKEAKKSVKPTTPSKGKKGGKGPAVASEAAVQRQLETGLLRLTLPLRPVAEHRNWLRSGTTVTMYKTTLTAVARPPTAPDPADATGGRGKAGGGGGKKKKDEPAPVEYDITSATEAVGSAVLRAGAAVVDGYTLEASERLDFVPPPPLFDERGIRTALQDSRHSREAVGHVDVSVRLHVPLPLPLGPGGAGGEG
ncbi:hypothetical protein PLESTB_000933400 [Pleodorina starrii]|uniref:Uncharacterized protein n=1 Tax=Pleodorina starrii TaxID=330485 RepID=A0A9W6F421_9CHLO|nr:hypothetical protein PLESTM_001551800 [Pleodorina starrii]GLC55035.1 hypothetical protein PLESTB_000933400 [Pleodorina starrii]